MVDAWRRHRFFEGLARGILAVDQPTLLVLDDLQWCDDETTAWLPLLLGRAAGAPLLIAATARREELADNAEVSRLLPALRSAGSLIEMALPPLGRNGVRALAASFLDREPSDEEVSLLVTATGGYPLYVVEAIRSASERDQGGPLSSLGDLSSVLRSRLEAASPHAREVAALASAVGRDFTLDLLTEASDLDVDAVVRSVDELWRQGIFREQPSGYDFSHDLIRDAAYASVSPPHRWLLHRRIAQGLQILHGEREDESLLSWLNSTTGAGDPTARGTTTGGRRSLPPPYSPTLRPCVASADVWSSSRSSRLGERGTKRSSTCCWRCRRR